MTPHSLQKSLEQILLCMEWLSGELAEASNENDLAIDLLVSKIGSTSTDNPTKIKVTRTRFQPSGKP